MTNERRDERKCEKRKQKKERRGREREERRRVTNRETEQQHFNNTHICMLSRASGHVAGANMPWIFLLFSRQTGPRCLLFVLQPRRTACLALFDKRTFAADFAQESDTPRSCTLDVTWYPRESSVWQKFYFTIGNDESNVVSNIRWISMNSWLIWSVNLLLFEENLFKTVTYKRCEFRCELNEFASAC